MNEKISPGAVLDLLDWKRRIFALYADVQAANFVFGIEDDSGTIGPGTTIWLDTDLNSTTGYQVFGNTVGAEYNIDIGMPRPPLGSMDKPWPDAEVERVLALVDGE